MVMVQDLPINDRLEIPAAELHWRFSRSSGPGWQGINTTDSKVELNIAVIERLLVRLSLLVFGEYALQVQQLF